jgi:hypothetical protein
MRRCLVSFALIAAVVSVSESAQTQFERPSGHLLIDAVAFDRKAPPSLTSGGRSWRSRSAATAFRSTRSSP